MHTCTAEGKPALARKQEQEHAVGKADINAFRRLSHLCMEHRAREPCISWCSLAEMRGKVKMKIPCGQWCFEAHIADVWSLLPTCTIPHHLYRKPQPLAENGGGQSKVARGCFSLFLFFSSTALNEWQLICPGREFGKFLKRGMETEWTEG